MPSRLMLLFFKEGTLIAIPTRMESTVRLPRLFGNLSQLMKESREGFLWNLFPEAV